MTSIEFRNAVKLMREAQNFYFATRELNALNKAKELEKRIDEELSTEKELTLF